MSFTRHLFFVSKVVSPALFVLILRILRPFRVKTCYNYVRNFMINLYAQLKMPEQDCVRIGLKQFHKTGKVLTNKLNVSKLFNIRK
jgi:hypothetical protein